MSIKSNAEQLAKMKQQGLLTPTPAAPGGDVFRPPLPPVGPNNELSRGQSPSSYSTNYDQVRNSDTNAIPSVRIPPAPALANQGANASSGSYTDRVVQPVFTVAANAATTANAASTTAVAASNTAAAASSTAAAAASVAAAATTSVAVINGSTAVSIVSGVLQQIPISTLGHVTTTPNLDNLNDGSTFNRVLATVLTSNAIDSTKTGFKATIGSFPSTVVGTTASILSYTSTTTSITFTWSSFMILFSDGTTETVASGSQAITGLSASQTYYAYPVVVGTALALTFIAVSGGVGSPAILYQPQNPQAAQQQNLQSNTAMSAGGIACVTPASGSGGGHGGGSGICLRAGQFVESKSRGTIKIEDAQVGEFICGRNDWTEVVGKKVLPQSHFVRVTTSTGEQVVFTPTHWTTAIRDGEETTIPAGKLTVSDFLITRDGYTSIKSIEHVEEDSQKVQLSCEPEHEFFCSASKLASILVHNVQPVS
jgi:hypothetical protein